MESNDSSRSWDLMADELTAVVGDPVDKAATLASVRQRLLDRGSDAAPTLARHILLRRLGAGGSGVVYEAFDPELERKVAIKLLKATDFHHASLGVARLKREAQAMARLSHPNVITVYDVGSYGVGALSSMVSAPGADRSEADFPPEGIFVVMELVDGPNLRAWMKSDHSWRARLEVMVQAGRGLAAAHAQGLVHRDFKPDNVLVGSDAAGPEASSHRVRVLDFGLARAVSTGGTSSPISLDSGDDIEIGNSGVQSPLTRSGVVAGTPAYMSPEQHIGGEADARSDQYNFCVTLFEVMAGRRPFPRGKLKTLIRAKRKGQLLDPPRDTGVPERIWRAIRKGLSAEPQKRFPSMEALLRELEYRRGAWLRWAVPGVAVASAPIALWVGQREVEDGCEKAAQVVSQTWTEDARSRLGDRIRAVHGARGTRVWDKARDRLDAYVQTWQEQRREVCRAMTDRAQVAQPTAAEAQLACLERRRADLQTAIDVLVSDDDAIVNEVLRVIDGLQSVDACEDPTTSMELLPPPGAHRVEALEIISEVSRADVMRNAGQHARQAAIVQEALKRARTLGHEPTLARVLLAWGSVQWDAEHIDEALAAMQEAAVLAERHDDERIAVEALLMQAGLVGKSKLQFEVALRMLEWVEARTEDPHIQVRVARFRGMFYERQARPEDAVEVLEKAVALAERTSGPDSHPLVGLLTPLANAYSDLGRSQDAFEAYQRALAIRKKVLGEGPGDAMIYNNLGGVLTELGRVEEACRSYEKSHDMFVEMYGREHSTVAMVLNNLGICHLVRGDVQEALVTHRRSLAIKERTVGPEHPDCGYSHVNIGDALLTLKREDEAARAHERGLEIWRKSLGKSHPMLAVPMAGLAEVEMMRGNEAQAELWIDQGLEVLPVGRMGSVRARLMFVRARLIHDEDPVAGVELARQARVLPGIEEDPLQRDAIDAWLSDNAAQQVDP